MITDYMAMQTNEERRASQIAAQKRYKEKVGREELARRMRERRAADRERTRALGKAQYEANREKRLESARRWRQANPDKMARAKRAWNDANPDKTSKNREAWKEKNAAKVAAMVRERNGMAKRATPAWANLEAMSAIYELARTLTELTGEEHHVDHTIPLKHKLVCGLHCEANLQVLTAVANLKKGNRFTPG